MKYLFLILLLSSCDNIPKNNPSIQTNVRFYETCIDHVKYLFEYNYGITVKYTKTGAIETCE